MPKVLGLDIGSVSISAIVMNEKQDILQSFYKFHLGAIENSLMEILKNIDLKEIDSIAVTSSTPLIIKNANIYNSKISLITAVKKFHPEVRGILVVGGENFGYVEFNENGEYESYKTNTSCASGTGSFLDQQAARLKIDKIESLAEIANSNKETTPKIATRCSVFAKTDLIHCQQEGYSLSQICDGLCEGLVQNIADTLFSSGRIKTPLVFSGGVSRNQAVVKHLIRLIGSKPIVDGYSHLHGAIGAAILNYQNPDHKKIINKNMQDIFLARTKKRNYANPNLKIKISKYPDFDSLERYKYSSNGQSKTKVEVDIYEKLKTLNEVYLGIDIGSTSTKAVIIDKYKKVIAGFYTETAGAPLNAVKLIFEAIDDISKNKDVTFDFKGAGTTGSGRKLIGKIINADLVIDEITAHARAAFELDPEVDTIIEIGGQDSKFTSLNDGMVTFSIMNNVCAAGTGSFIEEQAQKLGCPLSDYSERAQMHNSPMSSDRCTVFMERDLNYLLSEGYKADELLASVLHSVRDNYLHKVAGESKIGETILFQGATAKNKALVAAFEQKLNKPIIVSKFCHLTGAFGAALMLQENLMKSSGFRGISIYHEKTDIENEICNICSNHCKINKFTINNEVVAFGFLCGRDYNSKDHKNENKKCFNLLKEVKNAFEADNKPEKYKYDLSIGIPCSLYLSEEKSLWNYFFNHLGIKIILSDNAPDTVRTGKHISEAEFCAPISSFYGHVKYLVDKADYLFLPVYLDSREKKKNENRLYCYYSQFASSLSASSIDLKNKTIMPLIDHNVFSTKINLYKSLNPIFNISYWTISEAYDRALDFFEKSKLKIKTIFRQNAAVNPDINVVLLGRPYSILDKNMNKNIPEIFSNLNINAFYQEMVDFSGESFAEIEILLKAFHWNYASRILQTALIAAKTEKLYPVFITSFKCGPDSFAIEYFKQIMDAYNKPYLILELDEHGSSAGYETRIEAGIRSFRNHYNRKNKKNENKNTLLQPKLTDNISGKILLFPSWDDVTSKLLEAVLIKDGIDARMVSVDDNSVKIGLKTNTGQCLPISIMYQSFIDYIESHELEPEKISVWMLDTLLACNITMFPYLLKSMFNSYGKGMEKVSVYPGGISFMDISIMSSMGAYYAYQFGGYLRKLTCKIRPYEIEKGSTNKILKISESILYESFLGNKSREKALREVVDLFKNIKVKKINKPKVAIFGDIYVRDNDILNQNLIETIEEYGGEVITTPLSDLAKILSEAHIKRNIIRKEFKDAIINKSIILVAEQMEKKYYQMFNEILNESGIQFRVDIKEVLEKFNILLEHSGESMDNLLKINFLLQKFPDLSLLVQTSPAFCCAGLVTEAMGSKIESATGLKVVSITYDGTNKNQNEKIIPYLQFLKMKAPLRRIKGAVL